MRIMDAAPFKGARAAHLAATIRVSETSARLTRRYPKDHARPLVLNMTVSIASRALFWLQSTNWNAG